MAIGNAMTRRLAPRIDLARLVLWGSGLCCGCALLFLGLVLFDAMSIAGIVALMFVFTLGAGLASPAAMTKTLGVDTHLVGSASGLYGFGQMAAGAVCTVAVGVGHNPALAAAAVLSLASLLGQFALRIGLWSERRSRECASPA
jgi:DHA1 family bicyclomycin/chloramphenicol resistance-like MFS transporter